MILCLLLPSLLSCFFEGYRWSLSPEAVLFVIPLSTAHKPLFLLFSWWAFIPGSLSFSVGSALCAPLIHSPPLEFLLALLSLSSSGFGGSVLRCEVPDLSFVPSVFGLLSWMNSVSVIFPFELGSVWVLCRLSRSWSKAFCSYLLFVFPIFVFSPHAAARFIFLKHNFG